MSALHDYIPIVGESVLDDLMLLSQKLEGKSIQNINSTAVGGGVAEILNRMVPLLKELDVDVYWNVIKGGEKFFEVTKKIHNTLHGKLDVISRSEWNLYDETIGQNLKDINLERDIIFVHDPQPLGLIGEKKNNHWIWRCHIDLSNPDMQVWKHIKKFVERFDASVFSAPSFSQSLSIPQMLIPPSIDPLSDKSKELPQETITEVVERFQIDVSRPIITQVSRFDYLKDPLGVIDSFKLARKYVDCQLILVGGSADDDPEGSTVLSQVQEQAKDDPDIKILILPPSSNIEINVIQRISTIILQKSIREGFGLTVSEALWKAKPVIASAAGGIPLQIIHKYSGILTHSVEGTAYWIKQLLQTPEFAKKLGENGREHVRQNFLLTRHLRDYLLLYLSLYHQDDITYF
ncbi:MAG: glycosyltransferase [bacterium]